MSTTTTPIIRKPILSLRQALWSVIVIWLAYTVLYTLHPGGALATFLEFIPGVLAVVALIAAGFSLQGCYLRASPISRTGLMLLAAALLLMPFVWFKGRWTGWNGMAALFYAPASGISQELFFRTALLPVLTAAFRTKPFLALSIHAFLFALWHIPKASMAAPIGGVIGVAVITFASGLLWGKQVQHDGTVVWLMGYHSILLIINSFFTWE